MDIASESISALIIKGKDKGEMIKRVSNLGNLSPCNSSNESYQNPERPQSKLFRQEGTLSKGRM